MKKSEEFEQRTGKHKPTKTQPPKTYAIRHDPDHVASAIKQHFDRRELYAIVRLLSASLPPQSHVRVDIVEGDTISRLYEGLRWSELRISGVPQWTTHVIKSGIWKYRAERLLGEIAQFDSFLSSSRLPLLWAWAAAWKNSRRYAAVQKRL